VTSQSALKHVAFGFGPKAPVPPNERCCSVSGAVKKVHHRSLPYNKRWQPLRKRRIRSVTTYGPSYRFESVELHKILRAARKGQFSAPAMFTAAVTTLSQSLAPLDASSWTLGSGLLGRWLNVARGWAVVNILLADTELLERCPVLKQLSSAVINFG